MARTLTTISTLVLAPGLLVGATATASPAAAPLAPPANVTVTIQAEGTDLSGKVLSPRPRKCAAERKVIVIRQRGTRGGGDDERFAMDVTDRQNGVWVWSTGNTGTEGRFYAKVKKKPGCKRDTSRTIRAVRN
jgi:hypothetical protein